MSNITKWEVLTYTDYYYKISHFVDCMESAHEYVERILIRGDFYKDKDGIKTFIPVHRITKIKIIPPGITNQTETETRIIESAYGEGK